MAVENYNLKQVVISAAGVRLTGFSENDAARLEPNEDVFALTVGSDGEKCRSRMNNDSKILTLTFLQSSEANDVLETALTADQISGAATFPMSIDDVLQGEVEFCNDCFIMREPNKTWQRQVGDREWRICWPNPRKEARTLDFFDLF